MDQSVVKIKLQLKNFDAITKRKRKLQKKYRLYAAALPTSIHM